MDRGIPRCVDLRTTDPMKKNESALHHQGAFSQTEKPKPDQESMVSLTVSHYSTGE